MAHDVYPRYVHHCALAEDARVFLGRLTHLEADAVVRLRPAGPDRIALWAHLPWQVLVTRQVPVDDAVDDVGDVTVAAAELLGAEGGALPRRRDAQWRWPLPPHTGHVVEEIPATRLRDVAGAAAGTLRTVAASGVDGRPVGVRALREALLNHVPIVIRTASGERVDVPQRLVQAVVRMGFVGSVDADAAYPVWIRSADRWVGLAARHGTAWLPPPDRLVLRPSRSP